MRKRIWLYLLFSFAFLCFSVKNGTIFLVPKNWPKPVYDFDKNPLSKDKIALGRDLFYDPILSKDNTISCAGCHSQYTAFTHVDHALSHGIGDSIGTRNSPSLMNLAWQRSFMWDGAIHHLDVQSLFPITHPREMGETIENAVQKLNQSTLYPPLFKKAFGDKTATGEHTLKAIAQFMLTLVSSDAKYDSVMRKQSFFTEQEQKGYLLFQKNCSVCHAEPLFTTNGFANNGLKVDSLLQDKGHMVISKRAEDSLYFKIPTLRNLEFSYPYMHDGRFKKIREVLDHYTDGIAPHSTLSAALKNPIVLSSNDKVDLVAFLLTLTDKHFLFNPKYSYPKEILMKAKD